MSIAGDATTGFVLDCRSAAATVAVPAVRAARHRRGGEPARPSTAACLADIVILAGNGYLHGIDPETEARVMPIDNYILATAPIGAGRPGGIIPGGEAVSDSRFVVYYFRPTWDGRLVFGGGETYSLRPPRDLAAFVRRHMLKVYPAARRCARSSMPGAGRWRSR